MVIVFKICFILFLFFVLSNVVILFLFWIVFINCWSIVSWLWGLFSLSMKIKFVLIVWLVFFINLNGMLFFIVIMVINCFVMYFGFVCGNVMLYLFNFSFVGKVCLWFVSFVKKLFVIYFLDFLFFVIIWNRFFCFLIFDWI